MVPEALQEHVRKNDREVAELAKKIAEHVVEEAVRDNDMAHELGELRAQVVELTGQVRDLVEMWQQARGAVTFMKTMAAVVAGGAAAWAWISAHLAISPK